VRAGSRKGSGAWGRGRKSRGRGRVHDGERGRLGGEGSDRRAPRVREGAGERTGFYADERDPQISERWQARADGCVKVPFDPGTGSGCCLEGG
jgi:hypothetical protein